MTRHYSIARLTLALLAALALAGPAPAASAREIFFDDFNDRNAADGTPVTWDASLGTWDASSGDYVATGSTPRVSRVLAHDLGNTSVRAQVRVTGNIDAALAVRRPQPNVGYAGAIRPDGTMAIARLDGDLPVFLGGATVPFNPVQQEVLLQFDAFGDKLSLWAWPVGQVMPSAPQLVAFDNTYAQGPAGLISAGFNPSPTDSTIFRFVQVEDTHITRTIPEPSTFVLMSLAGCGLLCARQRKHS